MEKVKPNQLAYFYLVEIEKTRLYLLSQRQIGAETALQMVLPALDDTHEQVALSLSQEQGFECKAVDVLAYAKNINLKPELMKAQPELLHMQLLANGHIPDNLAPNKFTRTFQLKKLCYRIYALIMVIAIAGLLLAGYYFWQGQHQKNQIDAIAKLTQQETERYELVAQNFPDTPIPGGDLKTAAEIADIVASYQQTPESLMHIVSDALVAFPDVRLNRMRWVLSEHIDIKDENDLPAQNKHDAASDPDQKSLKQIGFINAEISHFNGNYRAALATVSRLLIALRSQPEVAQATVLQEPVNVSSLTDLKGSTLDEGATERSPATFKIKIVLKPDTTMRAAK